MIHTIKAGLAFVALAGAFLLQAPAHAQDSMKQDDMKHDKMHGKLVLRLTNFKTSNGPDVHVILVATKDAGDDANFLKSNTERLELGKLKGNEGDQNYEIPAGTDLARFRTVSVYCERFNANFGAAPLEKF